MANGDLSRKITVEVKGEILELKNTINTMVDQLSAFAAEVTRVAREVGTDGMLGGQAEVRGVSGTWRELTDNVNVMARNLTEQVRGIARVVTAVANGDLKQELRLEAQGEIATLVDTINDMIVTLSTFADQVTGVARDVGVEGKLGGQADVPGAAGIWRDLTNNVNELAGNLTRQVRAIGDVATAVTKGDLTQLITVEARGEVALLKDNINQMIRTLAETTRVNQDQDWLKTNLTRFTRMLQGQRDLLTVARQVLTELAPVVDAQHGAFYMAGTEDKDLCLQPYASYARQPDDAPAKSFALGEGLVGQAALQKQRILVTDVPQDYVRIGSGLGDAAPRSIVVVPVLFEDEVKGVIELGSFHSFTPIQLAFLEQLLESLGIVVATIEATMRTDELLRQSQSLAQELQNRQEELQQTNEKLEEKARQLTKQKSEVERKNQEVELARRELEEKAEQLALTSRYKSQFLANMSHELRTPLNSLLILSRQLADNPAGNLDDKQVEYARTVHQAGVDLLELINEILDLAKIESGTMAVEVQPVDFEALGEYVDRSFRQIAEQRGLAFSIDLDNSLPTGMFTDEMRLKQVLRNLLSNAFKFTERGNVSLRITRAAGPPWRDAGDDGEELSGIAFAVVDTGIGISRDQHRIIFEAFQQADGGTSRRYGGTGLGLSISREIAMLLGGELEVESEPGAGSTFTLFLPRALRSPPKAARRKRIERPRAETEELPVRVTVPDDREEVGAESKVLLIIEDDEEFARTLLEAAREHDFLGVIAVDGKSALELARSVGPDAITLDLRLPDMDGWVVLDRLKHDPQTRHIPIQIIAGSDEAQRGMGEGAIAFLRKPTSYDELEQALDEVDRFISGAPRRLLLIEDDDRQRGALIELIGSGDVSITSVASAEAALEVLENEAGFRCMVVDLSLPGMSGLELLRTLQSRDGLRRIPVIVYTGAELSPAERAEIDALADRIVIKDARSPERLLEETALFLHRLDEDIPEQGRQMLRSLRRSDPTLRSKRVMVVDDDVRNIFAITAVLEPHGVIVSYAENGQQALSMLEDTPVDLVLMDIMMPSMDGYEATRRIREQPRWRDLPVIALTAKAMKGDRDKCIQSGASDYITKPVDPDQLVSLLRVWLNGDTHRGLNGRKSRPFSAQTSNPVGP